VGPGAAQGGLDLAQLKCRLQAKLEAMPSYSEDEPE